jgi:beta-galactosidase
MYPSLDELERIARREEERPEGVTDDDDTRRRALPFLLIEYAHAMGNGPGSLGDYWRILESHDRMCGGFVWEWIDHGFFATDEVGTRYVMHGSDVDYEPNGGRYCLDGLVFADRTPSPALIQLAKAYEPLQIGIGEKIEIANKRHSADTSDVEFLWTLEADGVAVDRGKLALPVIAPGCEIKVPLPVAVVPHEEREQVLTVEAVLAKARPWAPEGHGIAWGQGVLAARPAPAQLALIPEEGREPAEAETKLGSAVFASKTGRLKRLGSLEVDGPWLDLHRAPTENDHGQGELNDIAAVWRATGMDRMIHRTSSVRCGDGWLHAAGRTAPAAHPHGVEWSMLWVDDGDGLTLTVDVGFVGPWSDTPHKHRDIWVPRLGLLLALPGGFEVAEWYGRGPGESYADSFEGCRLGRYRRVVDELGTEYPVPQENGNHVQTRWLRLEGSGVPALRVEGVPSFDFTARRWTSLDLERARKPYELVDSGRVWLNIDHAQQGLGSASVGPELPEQYRIPRTATQWSVRLAIDAKPARR